MDKDKAEKDLKANPIMFATFPVKQKVSDKYLGQVLHSGWVEASATATVLERTGRIKGATMEIRSIVEEYQMQSLGGLAAAWECGRERSYPAYSVEQAPGWVTARKLLASVTNYITSIGE